MEYIVERISDVKIAPFGRKRGLWLQFLVHYSGYPEPEWSLLSDVDDLEALDKLYTSTTWHFLTVLSTGTGRGLILLVSLSAKILPLVKFFELKGGIRRSVRIP